MNDETKTRMAGDDERLRLLDEAVKQTKDWVAGSADLSDGRFLELKKTEVGVAVTLLAADILEAAARAARNAVSDFRPLTGGGGDGGWCEGDR